MIKLDKGDIVIKYRPKYRGIFRYLIQRLICFFTTEWWEGEKTSITTHAEMVTKPIDPETGDFEVVTMEPPRARYKSRGLNNRKIVRLRYDVKPPSFYRDFDEYVEVLLGRKYDYLKFLMFALDWLFHTHWFSKTIHLRNRDVCSESVAYFYQRILGHKCSVVDYENTSPDDIYDYTDNKNGFITVYDAKEAG